MSNTAQYKAGDVVLGAFATSDGKVLHHYSIVLMSNKEGSLLAYTTSLKENGIQCAQRFTSDDMKLANWTTPCRWDGSRVCVVPNSQVRKTGSISKSTLAQIQRAYQKALSSRSVQATMLTAQGEVVKA